jgi:hypothetical protein
VPIERTAVHQVSSTLPRRVSTYNPLVVSSIVVHDLPNEMDYANAASVGEEVVVTSLGTKRSWWDLVDPMTGEHDEGSGRARIWDARSDQRYWSMEDCPAMSEAACTRNSSLLKTVDGSYYV